MNDIARLTSAFRLAWLALAGTVAVGCTPSVTNEPPPQTTSPPAVVQAADVKLAVPPAIDDATAKALADFNRGAALVEQYKYSDAAEAFRSALKLKPGWTAAKFNLGIACFNMHGQREAEESLESARRAFEEVLAAEPKNLRAVFCLGLYYQYLGENEKALERFKTVYEADDQDPYAAYKYAETLIATGRNEKGTKVLQRVVELDPGFISAVYRLALQYRRERKADEAKELFLRFQKLSAAELAGGSFAVQNAYGTVGKYYRLLGPDSLPLDLPQQAAPMRMIFSPETKTWTSATHGWDWNGGSIGLAGIAVGDVDDDGDLDVFLTATGNSGTGSLWTNDGSGQFTEKPIPAERCVAPTLGDIDNDGDLDLWIGRAGPDLLLTNDGQGSFSPANLSLDSKSDELTAAARLVDIDSDGDLDMMAFRLARGSIPSTADAVAASNRVLNNNRDGTFSDVAAELGLAMPDLPTAAVVADDMDNDRDLDLVVFPAGQRQPVVWINDRAGAFHTLNASATGLNVAGAISATSGDPDKDGDRDLLVFSDGGARLFRNQGQCRFTSDETFAEAHGGLRGTGGQFADMDNDGDLDVVIADARRVNGTRGPALLLNDWPEPRFSNILASDPGNLLEAIETGGDASCVAADFNGNGWLDLLLVPTGREPQLVENVSTGNHWVELDLRGTAEQDQKTRSNNSAIGARVEIKTGTVFQQYVVGTSSGPVAMAPLRIHAGLGPYMKVDWLRILWPDAVLQAEVELAGNRVATITELSRKTSSCPYLFAWTGERYEFVSDFGGVGGLGYLAAPGTYAPPDPTEVIRLPQLAADDGQYVLNVLSALEEVTYFDEARLVAVDHPVGTEAYPNEMMAISVAPPEFEVFCFGEPIAPEHAIDHRGGDVTDELLRTDRRYAGAVELDSRFAGIAKPHFVELDFGDRLKLAEGDRLVLVADGWVEYGYSSTNFAAGQAGLRCEAPSISVFRQGRWVEVFHEVGYPAGINHVMTLDVTGKILPGDRKIRIASNMELYWDRIFLAVNQSTPKLSLHEVSAAEADLHDFGYPREYSPDGRHPNLCDYANVDPTITWKLMPGNYTRYGDVTALVHDADDCFAIMAHGEELTLRFPVAAFGPVPEGQCRTFLLKTDSYCKDMDLYTAHPDTIEPLPFHGMSGYPYGPDEHYPDDARRTQYRQKYNTRHIQRP